jgi:tetratricopeptide (TPR) repeat protein
MAGARRHLDEALALARGSGDAHQTASALTAVAQLDRMHGNVAAAEPLYEEALVLARRLGDPEVVAVALLNLTMVYIARGAHNSAREGLQEIVAIADETRSMPVAQSVLGVAAGLATMLGEPALGLRLFGAAETNTSRTGITRDAADDAFLQPIVAQARAALGPAAAAAESAGRALGYEEALGEVRAWLARER